MTKPKTKPKAATRSTARKIAKAASRKRSAPASFRSAARPNTKHARIIAMLRTPMRRANPFRRCPGVQRARPSPWRLSIPERQMEVTTRANIASPAPLPTVSQHPNYTITWRGSETNHKDTWGHVTYNYHCEFIATPNRRSLGIWLTIAGFAIGFLALLFFWWRRRAATA